MKGYKLLQ